MSYKNIPFFSLDRHIKYFKKEIVGSVEGILDKTCFVGGGTVCKFERSFSEFVGSKNSISCNSGTDALWLSLNALGLQKGGVVLTTPFSFIASASEIVSNLAIPVFIDVDDTYNLCPQKLNLWLEENAVLVDGAAICKVSRKKISGILSVDLFGKCADFFQIKKIALNWGLWIVEDACQAVGAKIRSKFAGTLGDVSCFSLYPTKNLGVCGDGGIVTTADERLAKKIMCLRNHGRKNHYEYEFYGKNSRLDSIQAAIASCKLEKLNDLNKRRRQIAKIYDERFAGIDIIKTPVSGPGYDVYHQYCIQVIGMQGSRDFVARRMKEMGVVTNIFYPLPLHKIKFLNVEPELSNECPVAEELSRTILALPIWPELYDEEVEYVCSCLEKASSELVSLESGAGKNQISSRSVF